MPERVPTRRSVRRGLAPVAATLALATAGSAATGCRDPARPDTTPVVLTDGTAGGQRWRLEGRRLGGQPCVTLVVEGREVPAVERCGIRRTAPRTLEPAGVTVGGRLLVFSPLVARARRVRLDHADGALRIVPARSTPGFPARFFLADLDPADDPVAVAVFAQGGRAVVA